MSSNTFRRLESLKEKFGQADDNFFMLDENISDLVLRDLVQEFGPSSHVKLEGLNGPGINDESDIWSYMVKRRYKAILTADSDFKPISIRHRGRLIQEFSSIAASGVHTPVVIHIVKNISRFEVRDFVRKYAGEIRQAVADNDCAYVCITDTGIEKHEPDDGLVERNIRMLPPRMCPLPRPSSDPAL